MTRNRAILLAWPEGAAALLGVLLVAWPSLRAAAGPFLRVFPYIVLGSGLFVGWRFGRGRLLFGLVTIAAAGLVLAWLTPPRPPGTDAARAGLLLISVLLPLNLAALAFLEETPPFGWIGRWWAIGFIVQALAVGILARIAPAGMASAMSLPVFPVEVSFLKTPQLVVVAFVAAAGLVGFITWRAPDPALRGFLWSTIATFVALNAPTGDRTLYLGAANLVLLVSMIESSYSLAFNDELTGIPGRRAFNSAMSGLSGDYVIALVDVDHFKKFNDQHGHDVGDQVLKMVAGRLAHVGDGGRGFRYGGEEFAVVFPGSTLGAARADLEALRIAVEASMFALRGADRPKEDPKAGKRERAARRRDLSVTVSIGAAEPGSDALTPAAVTALADQALYRAKEGGRNRVMTAP